MDKICTKRNSHNYEVSPDATEHCGNKLALLRIIGRMRTGYRVVLYLESYYIKILAVSIAYHYTEFLAIS